jgi:DNA-binding phage protein
MTKIAKESGVAYDTVQRIKYRQGDPAYGKIRKLADYFGFDVGPDAAAAETASAQG